MALIHESIKLAVLNAGLLGTVLAPTYPMLRDATQRSFFDVLERNEIPYDHQKSENLVTLTEPGSEILFRSANEFERLRGTNIAWFAFDELTYCEKEAWMRMMGRLRHPLAKKLAGIAAWTPKGFDWVYDLFIGPNKGEDYDAILATPRENLHLPADFYDTLARSYDTQFAKQELEGEYLNIFAGRCYHAFDRATHLRSGTFGFDPQAPICWSLDFNINPMCSVIVQFDDTTTLADRYAGRRFQRAKVLDEIWIQNATTLQACEEFGNRTLPWASRVHGGLAVNIYGDASGEARQTAGAGAPSDWETVRQWFARHPHEYRVTYKYKRSNPLQKDRVAAVNAMLRSATGQVNMLIDAQCKHLIEDLEKVAWKQGTAVIDKDSNKMLSHISDAAGYCLETECGLRAPGGYSTQSLV